MLKQDKYKVQPEIITV